MGEINSQESVPQESLPPTPAPETTEPEVNEIGSTEMPYTENNQQNDKGQSREKQEFAEQSQQRDLAELDIIKKEIEILGSDVVERTRQYITNEKYGGQKSQNEGVEPTNLQEKASNVLSREDYQYFRELSESTGEPFDPRGTAMHTTNNFSFERILSAGSIKTGDNQEGMYNTKGASFTDGDFELALTFQTLFDDQNTRSEEKKFNSQKYNDKIQDFIEYFWDKDEEQTKKYLGEIDKGASIDTLDDAIKISKKFEFKATPVELADNNEELSKLFGVTIVYDKKKIPDLSKEGTKGLQRDFELRSYREGGVPLEDASTIFCPEIRIGEIKSMLKEHGFENIKVRPSEEMEVARITKLLSE